MGGFLADVGEGIGKSEVGRAVLEDGISWMENHLGPSGEFLAKGLRKASDDTAKYFGPSLERIKNSGMSPQLAKADAMASHKTARLMAEPLIFGRQDSLAKMALKDIKANYGDAGANHARDVFEKTLGRPMAPFLSPRLPLEYGPKERAFRSLESAHKLTLAPLSHIAQPLNTLLFLGKTEDAMGTFFNAMQRTAQEYQGGQTEWSLRSGGIAARAFDDIKRKADIPGILERISRGVLKPLDIASEYMEKLGAYAGDEALENAYNTLKRNPNHVRANRLLDILTDGKSKQRILESGLTEDDHFMAMRRGKDFIQAPTDVAHVPLPWLNTPIGRTATMYKPFLYKQFTFLKNHVFDEGFRYGNWKPFMYFSILYPVFGELGQDLKSLARSGSWQAVMGNDPTAGRYNRPSWEHPISRLVDSMSQTGGIALISDTIGTIGGSYGTPLGMVFGPPYGDLERLYNEFGQPFRKYVENWSDDKNTDRESKRMQQNLIKEALRAVPYAGTALAGKYKPSKAKPWIVQRKLNEGAIDKFLGTDLSEKGEF